MIKNYLTNTFHTQAECLGAFGRGPMSPSSRKDEIYELNTVVDQAQQSQFNYDYDPTGNRLTSNEQGNNATYVPNNLNQYSRVNNTDYNYDLNAPETQCSGTVRRGVRSTSSGQGNLTDDGTNQYEYDYENRLIRVIASASEATYAYDPLGRRLTRHTTQDPSLKTLFIHDGNQIIESYTCDLQLKICDLQQSFIYSNRIDEPLMLTNHGKQTEDYYYHHDALGNIVAITNSDAELVELYQYGPYGDPRFFDAEGESIPESTINNPYLFTGREWDSETNLQYSRARYYNPRIGRFLQRDPLTWGPDDPRILSQFNEGKVFQIGVVNQLRLEILNVGSVLPRLSLRYLYVGNNAVNFIDPSGEISLAQLVAVLAGLGALKLLFHFNKSIDKAQEAIKKAEELRRNYPEDTGRAIRELFSSKEFTEAINECARTAVESYTSP